VKRRVVAEQNDVFGAKDHMTLRKLSFGFWVAPWRQHSSKSVL